MKAALSAEDFAAFFRAVHGVEPFPWQCRLAERVIARGWPDALDVPTGAGKTAAIDVAVFHLALEADRGSEREAPVRIAFVVDRRLVVDEAAERATRIANKLQSPSDDVLRRVAARLGHLSEREHRPLVVSRLRGGMPREPDWIRTPAQPAVIVSTVDQVGSRLFFRGYGISDSMKPVHAGLLGSDALLFLDEAHLSQPFVESVTSSRGFQEQGAWSENAARAPFHVVTLSATQTARAPRLLQKDDEEHPVLGLRLRSSKPVELLPLLEPPDGSEWSRLVAERAWKMSVMGGGRAKAMGVVVNRIRRARAIFSELKRFNAEQQRGDLALLIGRSRPLDRDEVLASVLPRVVTNRVQDASAKPVIIVATQCIEAGADLDFDGLVTEIAPLDCLRQRFGRVNRSGHHAAAGGIIVASQQVSARSEPDPIYGSALAETWRLLQENAKARTNGRKAIEVIDFGVTEARSWLPEGKQLEACLAPKEHAPILMPVFLEQWACTSPLPVPDPEISFFLHGPESGPADAQLVWRADLESDPEEWFNRVRVCPPSTLEAISVPFYEVRTWLRGGASGDVADLDFTPEVEIRDIAGAIQRKALRWRGADDTGTQVMGSWRLLPGDLIVVPASYGGCDRWGWNPSDTTPVKDLGELANRKHRGREILRLAPSFAALAWSAESPDRSRAGSLRSFLESLTDSTDAASLAELSNSEDIPPSWRERLQTSRWRVHRDNEGVPLAVERRVRAEEESGEAVTESDASSQAQKRITLRDHSAGVRDVTERFATQAGLSSALIADLKLAAFLHDAGKAHPNFKIWLYGGDELAAINAPPLAKSGQVSLDPRVRDRAHLPLGARHEVASLAVAVRHPRFSEANDPDLVLWLVGTHHGHGRPFFPPVDWPSPGSTFSVDLGDGSVTSLEMPSISELTARWFELRARLGRRYGPWGLARLEAILRLADHRRSEYEQEETP